MTSRFFLGTFQCDSEEEVYFMCGLGANLVQSRPDISYTAGQGEVGETGNPHVQFVFGMTKSVRIPAAVRSLGLEWLGTHLEIPNGTRAVNREYVLAPPDHVMPSGRIKTGDVLEGSQWEAGVIDSQGKAHEWAEVQALLDLGTPIGMVAREHHLFWLKHYRPLSVYDRQYSLEAVRIRALERTQPRLIHLYGTSGYGKSSICRKIIARSGLNAFEPPLGGNSVWWDHCEGSEILFLDDFCGEIRFGELMKILDGPAKPHLQVKGAMVTKPHWKLILMTTNQPLTALYPKVDNIRQRGLPRRFEDFGKSHQIRQAIEYYSASDEWWPENEVGPKPAGIPWDPDFVTRHEVPVILAEPLLDHVAPNFAFAVPEPVNDYNFGPDGAWVWD